MQNMLEGAPLVAGSCGAALTCTVSALRQHAFTEMSGDKSVKRHTRRTRCFQLLLRALSSGRHISAKIWLETPKSLSAAYLAVDPTECSRHVRESGAAPRKGLKVRTDTWARRQAPLQDITAAHKHVSLSKEKIRPAYGAMTKKAPRESCRSCHSRQETRLATSPSVH